MSVHKVTSLVPVIRYRLQHTCSVYFSTHYDHERDERMFAILLELVQPENLGEGWNLREGWGLAKMLYYIKACVLRSPYFVILAVLLDRTEQIAL